MTLCVCELRNNLASLIIIFGAHFVVAIRIPREVKRHPTCGVARVGFGCVGAIDPLYIREPWL